MLTLRLEREADGVAVAEEAVDDGEADEGDAARDAHGARVRPAGAGARGALGARRAAPPGRGAVPAAAAQERGAQLLHLRLQALRAPQDAHALRRDAVRRVQTRWINRAMRGLALAGEFLSRAAGGGGRLMSG